MLEVGENACPLTDGGDTVVLDNMGKMTMINGLL